MAKERKNLDEGIRLNPTTSQGTKEGELWVDSLSSKLKIFLDGLIREFTTSNGTTAASVLYDNTFSGLNATNVQEAIDELTILIEAIDTSAPNPPGSAEGVIDLPFTIAASDGSKFSGRVNTLTRAGNNIFIGGAFVDYNNNIGKDSLVILDSTGDLNLPLTNNLSTLGQVSRTKSLSNGNILVSSFTLNYGGVSGRDIIIMLNPDGTVNTTTGFNQNGVDGSKFTTAVPSAIEETSAGNYIIGGNFEYPSLPASKIITLNESGSFSQTFELEDYQLSATVTAVHVSKLDGSVYVLGSFQDYHTTSYDFLVKFNSDGSVNNTFTSNCQLFNATPRNIYEQSNGKVLVGGNFSDYGAVGNNFLIRLNADGTLDTSFTSNASSSNKFSSSINVIDVEPGGKVLVGGNFKDYELAGNDHLIRLNSDGTLDDTFTNNISGGSKFNNAVSTLLYDTSDDTILIGGNFTDYDGVVGRDYLIKIK